MVYSSSPNATEDMLWLTAIWLVLRRQPGGRRSPSENETNGEQQLERPDLQLLLEHYAPDIAALEKLGLANLRPDDLKSLYEDAREILEPVLSGESEMENIQKVADAWWEKFGIREIELEKQRVEILRRLTKLYGYLEQATSAEWREYARVVVNNRWSAIAESAVLVHRMVQLDTSESGLEATDAAPTPQGLKQYERTTDAAREKAQELGVDLSQIEGTGSGGKVISQDVVRFAKQQAEEDELKASDVVERRVENKATETAQQSKSQE